MEKTMKIGARSLVLNPLFHISKIQSNWLRRTLVGATLITLFSVVIYIGPFPLLLTALAIQIKCFDEIISISYNINKISGIPYYRTLNWYFVIAANYFFYGETFAHHFDAFVRKCRLLGILVAYHRFFSFCFYFIGIIWFVFSLVRKRELKRQFSLWACTHFLLIVIVLQSYMIVENLFQGIIWLIVPVSVVIGNDIFAYVFGRLMGKTPLIEVSPRKTKEGYFYGAAGTFIFGLILSQVLSNYQYFVCPLKYIEGADGRVRLSTECVPSPLFEYQKYQILGVLEVNLIPFVLHSLALSFFASIIAPFGGFFASGFKRAFKVKDFSDIFPGHGGIMDRFDCQFLMATFVNVYIFTFINMQNYEHVVSRVMHLDNDNQLELYLLLKDYLSSRQML